MQYRITSLQKIINQYIITNIKQIHDMAKGAWFAFLLEWLANSITNIGLIGLTIGVLLLWRLRKRLDRIDQKKRAKINYLQTITIIGPTGSGKTWLLKKAIPRFFYQEKRFDLFDRDSTQLKFPLDGPPDSTPNIDSFRWSLKAERGGGIDINIFDFPGSYIFSDNVNKQREIDEKMRMSSIVIITLDYNSRKDVGFPTITQLNDVVGRMNRIAHEDTTKKRALLFCLTKCDDHRLSTKQSVTDYLKDKKLRDLLSLKKSNTPPSLLIDFMLTSSFGGNGEPRKDYSLDDWFMPNGEIWTPMFKPPDAVDSEQDSILSDILLAIGGNKE